MYYDQNISMAGSVLETTLKNVFKFPGFKSELQKNAIKAVYEGKYM